MFELNISKRSALNVCSIAHQLFVFENLTFCARINLMPSHSLYSQSLGIGLARSGIVPEIEAPASPRPGLLRGGVVSIFANPATDP